MEAQSHLISPSEFISLSMSKNIMTVDTETNGEDIRDGRGYAIGISATVKDGGDYYSAYFPVRHDKDNVDEGTKERLFSVIASRPAVTFHNAKFDTVSLKTVGYQHSYIRYYCTMLMTHMLNENIPKGLDWLVKNELKRPGKVKPPEWQMMYTIYGWSPRFPAHIMALYATGDSEETYRLLERLYPHFVKQGFDGNDPMQWLQELLP